MKYRIKKIPNNYMNELIKLSGVPARQRRYKQWRSGRKKKRA